MVLPLSDDNRDRTVFPVVNVVLIAANVLVFVALQGMGRNDAFTMAFAAVPAEILSGRDIVTQERVVRYVDLEPQEMTIPGLQKTPIPVDLTLLTAMFMHGGLMHLLGNMWFLWIFGDNIEQDLGRIRYLVFYLVCGILASLTHVLLNRTGPSSMMPSLGASGAISGVMGAYLVMHPQRRVLVLLLRFVTEVPGFVAVGLWFAFQLVAGLGALGGTQSGVAYGAHIGGFVAGAVLVIPFSLGRRHPQPTMPWREFRQRGA